MSENRVALFPTKPFTCSPFKFQVKGSSFEQVQGVPETKTDTPRTSVMVPVGTPWEPATMRQLMTGLFAILKPITLGIIATKTGLSWYIRVPQVERTSIRRLLYAVCPQAELQAQADPAPGSGLYTFPLHLAGPFVYPLQEIEAFGDFDPLVTLLSSMRELRGSETWEYQLTLLPLDPQYREFGQQLLDEWGSDAGYLDTPTLRMIEAKLNGPLKQVRLAMRITTYSARRAHQLAASSWPTWVQYACPGGNALSVPSEHTFTTVLSPGEMAGLWHLPNLHLRVDGIGWTTSVRLPLPEKLKGVSSGIILGTNSYQGQTHKARLTYEDRDAHVTVIGKTGTGKSTLLHWMSHQDIEAGRGVAVIDPHGDLYTDLLQCSIRKSREKEVIVLDTFDGVDCPIGLNPLQVPPGIQPYQVARQAFDLIKKLFASDWPGAQTDRFFAAAIRVLVDVPGASLKDIPRLLTDKAYRAQVIAKATDEQAVQTWRIYEGLKGNQAKIAEPILNRLDRFLSDPVLAHIICKPDSLNFREIMDSKKIFLANLGAFQEEQEADTLGAILLNKVEFAAMSRGNLAKAERLSRVFYLYVDELQRFTTTSLPIIYDQARKYGLSLVGAFQRLSQLPGEDFKGIASGVGALIAFATMRDDAKVLAPFLDERINAKALADLHKYTAVVVSQLEGQTLPNFTIETQSPLEPRKNAVQTIARIRSHCREQFGHSKPPANNPPKEDSDGPEQISFAG